MYDSAELGNDAGSRCGGRSFDGSVYRYGNGTKCATASIITLFLCPFIVAFFDKMMRKRQLGIYSPEGWAYQGQKVN